MPQVVKKSAAYSALEIGPEKKRSKVSESYSRQSSGSIFKVARHSKRHAEWYLNGSQNLQKVKQHLKIRGAQKHGNKYSQQVAKSIKMIENWLPWGQGLELRKPLKIYQFSEFRQNGYHGCPGVEKASQRYPKGVQKGFKRYPESMKVTSKRRPQGIRIR